VAAEAGAGRGRAAAGRRPRLAAVWRAYALLGSVCFGAGADKINGFRAVPARATFLCLSREPFSTASGRSAEHPSELPSLIRISYAVFILKKKNTKRTKTT